MANPQLENGYLKIANEIYDHLCRIRIPGEARQVLDVIIRKTYGFNKKEDAISLSQFVEATGLGKTHISRATKRLREMNIITQKGKGVTEQGNDIGLIYWLNKDYDSWKPLPKKVTLPKKVITVTQKGNESLPKKGTTKDKEKDNIKTEEVVPLWNEICSRQPKILKIGKTRQRHFKARLQEYPDLEFWRVLFDRIAKSDFMAGKNDRQWVATIDFVIERDDAITKILEGKYDNRKPLDAGAEWLRQKGVGVEK